MAIGYSIAALINRLRPQDPAKYYARMQIKGTRPLPYIAEEVSWGTSLTKGDVTHLVNSASERIAWHLRDGKIVDLGDFGKFQCQLSSKGAETPEKFKHSHIKKVRFQFRAGKLVRKALQEVTFEHVLSVKSRREAKKRLFEEEQSQQP